ncbi:MAG: HEPN domain-containing protein [Deltaproteobacteria bacterium]|jgi:uncharacterized protein (UPF0332 family)
MKKQNSQALISYRMERSHESLRAAEIMLENNMLTFSMNRIYYAMFYAVQAVLVLREVSFSKHGQVKAYFNREMVKTSIFPIEMGRLYNKAFEYRQKFDYIDFSAPDLNMVSEYLEKARGFIFNIQNYVQPPAKR